MMVYQVSNEEELICSYVTLRQLRCIREVVEQGKQDSKEPNFLLGSDKLFPTRFLMKLLDERFVELDSIADSLVKSLFRRLTVPGYQESEARSTCGSKSYPEIDEYFHHALYYVYDFYIEFDWHENDMIELTKSDEDYVNANLGQSSKFLEFKKILEGKSIRSRVSSNKTPEGWYVIKVASQALDELNHTSSAITTYRSDSPSNRRRVRFKEAAKNLKGVEISRSAAQGDNRNAESRKSILALKLLLYSLNIFIGHLANHLIDLLKNYNPDVQLDVIIRSKKKLKVKQLQSISVQIKQTNDLYLTSLDCLCELKSVYLKDYISRTLCARDSEITMKRYKAPILDYFHQMIGLNVDRKILYRLSKQFLQLYFNLLITDLNLPPVELNASTETRSSKDMHKSRTNVLNFIRNWLRIDDIIFGSNVPKRRSLEADLSQANLVYTNPRLVNESRNTKETSTLANFRSSSRILAQADNLSELFADFLSQIVSRVKPKTHIRYCLEIIYAGFNEFFDPVSKELWGQMWGLKDAITVSNKITSADDLKLIGGNINSLVVKTRILKLIHVMNLNAKTLLDAGMGSGVKLADHHEILTAKMRKFSDTCLINHEPLDKGSKV